MAKPTYDDVNLILKLYELRREEKLRLARDWFGASFKPKSLQEFNELCPPGSKENGYARMVCSYWDMVASFITSGVLNEELFFESGGELLMTWERVKPTVPELRSFFKNDMMFKNLEDVATKYIEYINKKSPGFYEQFKVMANS